MIKKGWRRVKLGNLCEPNTGTRDPQSKPNDEFEYIDISAVDNLAKRITETRLLKGKAAPSRARKIICAGDIILATTRPNLNAVAQISLELNNQICSTGFCVLRPGPEIDSDFLFFFVQSREFVQALSELVAGALYPAVKDSQVFNQEIDLPSILEQRRIAQALKTKLAVVERARQASAARLEAAQTLPAAYLRNVFESEEAQNWPTARLIDICCCKGQYGTSQKSNRAEKGLPVLGMKHIQDGRFVYQDLAYADLDEQERKKYHLNRGDLVFNRTNSAELVGKSAVFDSEEEMVFASYLIRFVIDQRKCDPRFVSAYINSPYGREFINDHMTRAIGQVNISASTMHEMIMPTPPLPFQRQWMDEHESRMRRCLSLITEIMKELSAIKSLPASILRQAFSGAL